MFIHLQIVLQNTKQKENHNSEPKEKTAQRFQYSEPTQELAAARQRISKDSEDLKSKHYQSVWPVDSYSHLTNKQRGSPFKSTRMFTKDSILWPTGYKHLKFRTG